MAGNTPQKLRPTEGITYKLTVSRDICYHSTHPEYGDSWCWYCHVPTNQGGSEEVRVYFYDWQQKKLTELGAGKGSRIKLKYNGKNPPRDEPKWLFEIVEARGPVIRVQESGGGNRGNNDSQPPQSAPPDDSWPEERGTSQDEWDDPRPDTQPVPVVVKSTDGFAPLPTVDLPGMMLEAAFWTVRVFEHPTFTEHLLPRLIKAYNAQPGENAVPLEVYVEWFKACTSSFFIERNKRGLTDIHPRFRITTIPVEN